MVLGRIVRRWQVNKWEAERGEFSTWSGTYPVYWYFDEDGSTIAKKLLGGTLMFNRSRIDKLSSNASKVVAEHEIGHLKGSFNIYLQFLIIFGVYILAYLEIEQSTIGFENWIFQGVALGLATIGIIFLRKWEEMMADLHALDQSSVETFRSAYEEIIKQRPQNIRTRLSRKLFYVNPETVVWFHRFLEENGLLRIVAR